MKICFQFRRPGETLGLVHHHSQHSYEKRTNFFHQELHDVNSVGEALTQAISK
ncbi:hypothetical protein [Legionella clemsonensis]|uniref:hypothetical protein n=1 Tax=Legionella clemsonensis TaxID=1867846 RepID=UPI0012FD2DD8|nr:hypothetical protein [Legionella clemsonensis]